MSTILQQAEQAADDRFKKARWALGLSGLLAIAFAVAILVWPNISLFALVIVFGALALSRGLVGLYMAIRSPIKQGRGWLVLSSLASIGVGLVVFFFTDMSTLALLYVIGAYAIVMGILTILAAPALLADTGDKILLSLTGLVSVVFGFVMIVKPGDGAIVLLALIAAYSLVVGISELTVAIGGRRLFESVSRDFLRAADPQTSH
jgi:uncharacterized membrane protein HdeD (DUF308 family)